VVDRFWVLKLQILVFINESGNDDRMTPLECMSVLRRLTIAVYGVQDEVALEVPGAYFTTQGISPRRDVDYTKPW
jgi:hypothetical protein